MWDRSGVRCVVLGVVAVVAMMSSGGLQAAQQEGPPETSAEAAIRASACDMLQQGRYAELDAKMNGLQQDYEAGRLTDISLMHSFRAFCPDQHRLDAKYDAWLETSPKSYAARLAYAVYLRDMAYYWRGGEFYDKLSPTQIETMTDYANRGLEQLRQSLTLTSKPMLSFHAMIGLAMIASDGATIRRAIEAADKLDPKNFVVRYKYIAGPLTTRWGGSVDEMIAFRDEAQQAGLPSQQLDYFDEQIAQEKWWLEHCSSRR